MKLLKFKRAACFAFAAFLIGSVASAATLTKVDIYPPQLDQNATYGALPFPGTYTLGAGDAFTMTGDGIGYYPGVNFSDGTNYTYLNQSGDVLTFAYETVTGDFDRRVRVVGVTNVLNPNDVWTRGGLMVRTSTNHYSATFDLTVSNPNTNTLGGTVSAGADQVRLSGRALDGQAYWDLGRDYGGVHDVIPNQWIRLRRVGDWFSAYVGKDGTNWSMIGQRYQEWPATLLVGPYAGSSAFALFYDQTGTNAMAKVSYATYGATPLNDTVPPTLVSAGTLDKKMVGVKFSEPVDSSTSTVPGNYAINQNGGTVTITSVTKGIGGNTVYLNVTGLTNDTFTVTVIGGVKDTAGNLITPNTSVPARALGWTAIDLGYIQSGIGNQSPTNRPMVGDDPYRVGRSVMVSSDENPEIEVTGGGSNQWNPGDFVHYIYRQAPLTGNFDVTIAVSRFDRSVRQGGYSNSGLMLRVSPYLSGNDPNTGVPYPYTINGTKVPMVALPTYIEASAPGRGAIPLWRTDPLGGYGNGNAGFSWQTLIGGVKGYYNDLRATDAAGDIDPQSATNTARYLRIKRVGTVYTFYASWNRTDWAQVDQANLPQLPDQLYLGFSTMDDSGGGTPPMGAYSDNGHQLLIDDLLNDLVPREFYTGTPFAWTNTAATGANDPGSSFMNESCYAVETIKVFPNGVTDPLPTSLVPVDIRPMDESTAPPNALSGSWSSTGTHSFSMTGGGTSGGASWQNLNSPFDGTSGGDEVTFAYETITGDFDKQIELTSLTNTVYNSDGSTLWDYSTGDPPVDQWLRAGLMVRTDTNAYSPCLEIVAGNPYGANVVRVGGHALDAQKYTQFSRDYPGVDKVLPSQYLRIKRVGNNFSFFVSADGVVWSTIAQQYMDLTNTVLFGPFTAASLNPNDTVNNPLAAVSRASATFSAYQDVNLGDLTAPVLLSTGTIDKQTVGVKFSEQVSSATGTVLNNYKLSQGTVTAAKMGIGGDAVYLTVSGLTSNTFTVTVTNVTDTFGNKLVGSQSAQGKVTAWTATDIGYIQNPANRPTPGDDPYRVGQTVATSSDDDDTSELEVCGGGSNEWLGDYIHYVYKPTPLSGDFDVACKISRYDKENTAGNGGYDNSGVMLRASLYQSGEDYTVDGTKALFIDNITYHNGGGGPIPVWRDTAGASANGSGNQLSTGTIIGGLKGYFPDTRATNAAGKIDSASSPYQAQWLRIQRVGGNYSFYASWDGVNWNLFDGPRQLTFLPDQLLLGYMTMNDSGASDAPFSAYSGNGHTIDPSDPLNPAVVGGWVQNESNFTVTKVRIYSNTSSIGAISAALVGGQMVIKYNGTLVSSSSLNGPWTVVPNQVRPYTVTPSGTMFYRVIP